MYSKQITYGQSFYLFRNNTPFGPYTPNDLDALVRAGKVLKCDRLANTQTPREEDFFCVRDVFKALRITSSATQNGNMFSQISHIGKDLLLPKELFDKETWKADTRLLMLCLIGMSPLVLGSFLPSGWLSFYAISLYFAAIWGMFFYFFFKTKQATPKAALTIFFGEQIAVFLIWDLLGLARLNFFYGFTNSEFVLTNAIGYILGVGVTEEFAKLLPLLLILFRTKQPLIPQTMVFYGLMSGIAFGVYEGVQYQLGVNAGNEYTTAYVLNIARMTTLPFIHALWCGIAGFFLSFAAIYPRYRSGLYFLAIAIPALAHGLYDTAVSSGSLLLAMCGLALCFFCVGLLMHYLKNSLIYQNRLK